MKILMFGWEFSPRYTGGLGVVCKALCDELGKKHRIKFILPKAKTPIPVDEQQVIIEDVSEVPAETLRTDHVGQPVQYLDIRSNLVPYLPAEIFREEKSEKDEKEVAETHETEILKKIKLTGRYDGHLSAEVTKYTLLSTNLYEGESYDIIHAHDWIGASAGMLARRILKIPLVFHIHSTEYDRNGGGGNENIRLIEKRAIEVADAIICVSHKTKADIIRDYHADPKKISVVPNATTWRISNKKAENQDPVIGFLGRFATQKAPGKLIDLARLLVSDGKEYLYTMIGDGHQSDQLAERIREYNLADHFTMTGFLESEKVKKNLSNLSVLVIPSVSEPFGLVALEATARGVPVLITENAGVNEYLPFRTFRSWDLHGLKDMVIRIVENKNETRQYVDDCRNALKKLSWKKSASLVSKVYQKVIEAGIMDKKYDDL